eukprot:TRINITY_DN39483_c0_g1_i1.p1 TRINITY_DN39483_c0_g1~~TRINITY_DN39483_c0_g1_i1.p1  ORF type:complete len:280 (-),score=56.48 TRINITY_DN39483_c0_g1_i1:76-870(-)
MPHRLKQAGLGLGESSSRSSSTSPVPGVGLKEFNDLKDAVQSIFARLEILERVFVFVDIEKINDTLSKYNNIAPPAEKVGIDAALTGSQWEALPSRLHLGPGSAEESGGYSGIAEKARAPCGRRALPPLTRRAGPLAAKGLLHGGAGDAWTHGWDREGLQGVPESASEAMASRSEVDGRQCPDREVEDAEKRSTTSSWGYCSTREGLEMEADVDPDVLKKFMSQALKPRWESRLPDQPEHDLVAVEIAAASAAFQPVAEKAEPS